MNKAQKRKLHRLAFAFFRDFPMINSFEIRKGIAKINGEYPPMSLYFLECELPLGEDEKSWLIENSLTVETMRELVETYLIYFTDASDFATRREEFNKIHL